MFKWERRLVEAIDKQLPILAYFLIILFALHMRRMGYYYNSFDFKSHFYPALPGYLYTPFYTLVIRILPALSITPAMQVRILVCLFDFAVATGAVRLLKEIQTAKDKMALLSCFTLLVVSPLTIEYGLLWIRPDSVCMSAFLWSFILYKRHHNVMAGILLGIGAAILTQYTVLFLLLAFYSLCKKEKILLYLGSGIITIILLNAAAIGILGLDPQNGIFMLFNWFVKNPIDGTFFPSFLLWLKTMVAYFSYMIGTLCLIGAFSRPKYRVPAAVIHLLLLLYVGYILQNGW